MEGVAEIDKLPKKQNCKRDSEQSTNKGKSPMAKRRRITDRRNSKMKPRLGGSLSDPLNLEVWSDDNECSTCAPSPSDKSRKLGDQSRIPLPMELHNDPLNLEEKIPDFTSLVETFNQILPVSATSGSNKRKKKRGNRRKSQSDSSICDTNQLNNTTSSSTSSVSPEKSFNPKSVHYRYGNYDRYYSYRNNGPTKSDPRLKLFNKEWFKDKQCLDIGSNTGQVTIEIGRYFSPSLITGIDIDSKLVRMACKNLHRVSISSVMPDGRHVPRSILMSFGPIDWLTEGGGANGGRFPDNVKFLQNNYVPLSEEDVCRTRPQYDVIMCLSVSKWIHLNWGDEGLKRMFRKIYLNLRPGGRLLLEPQDWESYRKRRKLTSKISDNYHNIKFFPDQFHNYLMSPDVGFTVHQFIGIPPNHSNPGFQRPLHMYIKDDPPTCDKPHPLPTPPTCEMPQSNDDKPHPLSTSEEGTDNKPHPPLELSGIQLTITESAKHSTQEITTSDAIQSIDKPHLLPDDKPRPPLE